MKTEQIIKTLNHWTPCLLTSKEEELAINAAIERLQELERERDEARDEAETVRALYKNATVKAGTFPWEKEREKTRAD